MKCKKCNSKVNMLWLGLCYYCKEDITQIHKNKKCKMNKSIFDSDCYNCKYIKDCLGKL